MNRYSITFRPHINDNVIFEEVLPHIISSLNKGLEYFYTVEKDETRDRHIHIYLETKERIDNYFRAVKKILYEKFECTNTVIKVAWKCNKVNEEHDKKMVLGYQQKEEEYKRRGTNISNEYLEQCKVYYEENKPPEVQTSKYKLVDMNKNNIKSHILDFCHRMKKPPNHKTLRKMLEEGYCSSNIPSNSLRRILLECKVIYGEKFNGEEKAEYDKPTDYDITLDYVDLNMRRDLRKIDTILRAGMKNLKIEDECKVGVWINSIIEEITDKYR